MEANNNCFFILYSCTALRICWFWWGFYIQRITDTSYSERHMRSQKMQCQRQMKQGQMRLENYSQIGLLDNHQILKSQTNKIMKEKFLKDQFLPFHL